MKNKTLAVIASLLVGSMIALTGCSDSPPSSDTIQRQQQEQILKQGTDKVGMPAITHFFQRETLKTVYEKTDDPKLTTYSYTQAMDGKFVYIGKTIGYPIPYSTEFTNPAKPIYAGNGGITTMPQADPNGLFSPSSADGTWVLLQDEVTGKTDVMYSEPHLVTLPYKLPKRLVESWSIPNDY